MTGVLRRALLPGAGASSMGASNTRARAQTQPQAGSTTPIDLHAALKYPFVVPPLP